MKHKRKTSKKAKQRAARAARRLPKEAQRELFSVVLGFAGTMLARELMKIGAEVRAKRKQRKKGAKINGRHARLGPNEPRYSVH